MKNLGEIALEPEALLVSGNDALQAAASSEGSVVSLPNSDSVENDNSRLVSQFQQTGNRQAMEQILERNQGLLHSILHRFSYFPDPYEDLLQVANIGLIKAVQRFDPGRGVKFSSYASAIVDGEVRHHLRDNVLMRQPRWLRKAQQDIENASLELSRTLKRPPRLSEIAKKVNITEDGVLEIFKFAAAASLYSVDDSLDREKLHKEICADNIKSRHHETFTLPIEDRIALEEALEALSSLHKKIVYLLFYRGLSQAEAACELGLNQKKVSRESIKALDRLRAIMNTKVF